MRTATLSGLMTVLIVAAGVLTVDGQQVSTNSTPGLGDNNHTVFVYDPYAWAFKDNDLAPVAKKFVANTDGKQGQQYSYMELREPNKPTDDNPAKICTAVTFRDLINKNAKDMGVLVISTHGGDESISVEAFASAEKRDETYLEYTKNTDPKTPALFTTDEITKTSNPDGPAISATAKFIEKYEKLNSAFVYIDACEGETLVNIFTKNDGGRVAIGAQGCPGVNASFKYGQRFFSDLDGQPIDNRSDLTRLQLRAVGPAMNEENRTGGVKFSQSNFGGNTTLAPRVMEERAEFAFKCPLGKGDTINLVFDTECEKKIIPEIVVEGITVGTPAWQGDSPIISHNLKIPVMGPEVPARTYKFTMKGSTLQSGNNIAALDGNINPNLVNKDGSGVNARGPANSKATVDNYVVQYDDCKRVH